MVNKSVDQVLTKLTNCLAELDRLNALVAAAYVQSAIDTLLAMQKLENGGADNDDALGE